MYQVLSQCPKQCLTVGLKQLAGALGGKLSMIPRASMLPGKGSWVWVGEEVSPQPEGPLQELDREPGGRNSRAHKNSSSRITYSLIYFFNNY